MPTGKRPPIPPLHAKVVAGGIYLGHQWRNISYLAVAGSDIGNADLNSIAGGINTAWTNRWKPMMNSSSELDFIQVVYVPDVGQELTGLSTNAWNGSSGGTALLDAAASYVINWNVNRYYRGGHPRWYVPGVSTADVSNGSDIGGAKRTSLATAGNGFINDVNALTSTNITSVTLGTISFQHLGAWRVPPVFWQYMTASASAKLGTQRRRIHS